MDFSPHYPVFSIYFRDVTGDLWSLEKKGGKALVILIAHSQRFLLGSTYLHKAQVMYYTGHIYSSVFIPCAYALGEMLRY